MTSKSGIPGIRVSVEPLHFRYFTSSSLFAAFVRPNTFDEKNQSFLFKLSNPYLKIFLTNK